MAMRCSDDPEMEIVEVLPHLHMLLPEFGQVYLWHDA